MTVAGQAAIADAAAAKASAEAAALANGSTSYSYYDRGVLKQVNVASTREKLLTAAIQTGQGFGSLGGTTVESRTAYARSLGFSPTEVRTATGELPYGSRTAEKQKTTQDILKKQQLNVIRPIGTQSVPETQRPTTTGYPFYFKPKEYGGEIRPVQQQPPEISPEAMKFLGIKQPGLPKAQPKPPQDLSILGTLQTQQEKLFYKKQLGKTTGERAGARVEELFTGVAVGILTPFVLAGSLVTQPKKTVINIAKGLRPYELGKSIVVSIRDRPIGFAGEIAGSFASTAALGETAKFLNPITRTQELKIALTGEYVPPSKVFAPEVLAGEQTFPSARNVESALKQFRQPTQIVKGERQVPVVHTTTAPFQTKETVTPGPAGRRLLEDPGLFVSAGGRASPYFLKLGTTRPSTTFPKISLVPDFASMFKTPSVVEITTRGVERLPRKIIKAEGFEPVADFFKTQVGKGKAFISKRFELGQTHETEAVIPVGSRLVEKKPPKPLFTTFRGRVIPIQQFELKGGRVSAEEFGSVAKNIKKAQQSFEGSFGRKPVRAPLENLYNKQISGSLQQNLKPLSSDKAVERMSGIRSDMFRSDIFRQSTKRTNIERPIINRPYVERPIIGRPPPPRPPPPERPFPERTPTGRPPPPERPPPPYRTTERPPPPYRTTERPPPPIAPPFFFPKPRAREFSINIETKTKITTKRKPSLFGIALGKQVKNPKTNQVFGGFELRGFEKGLKLGGLFEGISTFKPVQIKKLKKRRLL